MNESVDHPSHYGGDTPYEVIKVIEAWGLGFHLGNVVKYIARAGKKSPDTQGEDLDKAFWYLQRYLEVAFERLRKENDEAPDMEKPKVIDANYPYIWIAPESSDYYPEARTHHTHSVYENCGGDCPRLGTEESL